MKKFELQDPQFLPHCGCKLELTLSPGEMQILVGENGIGKSTLLRRFYESLTPASRVVVEQKTSEYFYDRKLGVLKQIFLASCPPGLDDSAFHFLWQAFALDLKEDRMLSHLSGGESQCLKLCLSLPRNGEVYFLDEPSQYLDSKRKEVLLNYLNELKAKNKMILVIEHNRDWLGADLKVSELGIKDELLQKVNEWTT